MIDLQENKKKRMRNGRRKYRWVEKQMVDNTTGLEQPDHKERMEEGEDDPMNGAKSKDDGMEWNWGKIRVQTEPLANPKWR